MIKDEVERGMIIRLLPIQQELSVILMNNGDSSRNAVSIAQRFIDLRTYALDKCKWRSRVGAMADLLKKLSDFTKYIMLQELKYDARVNNRIPLELFMWERRYRMIGKPVADAIPNSTFVCFEAERVSKAIYRLYEECSTHRRKVLVG